MKISARVAPRTMMMMSQKSRLAGLGVTPVGAGGITHVLAMMKCLTLMKSLVVLSALHIIHNSSFLFL